MKIQRLDEKAAKAIDFDEAMIAAAWDVASQEEPAPILASGNLTDMSCGATFEIDVVLPEGVSSGDGRTFEVGSTTVLEGPIPLMWQQFSQKGHDGAVIVGRIDHVERISPESNNSSVAGVAHGWGRARGVFDTGPYGREAERLVRSGFLTKVSGDFDMFEAQSHTQEFSEDDEPTGVIKNDPISIKKARLIAATLVSKPAYHAGTITITESVPVDYITPVEDGMYEEALEDEEAILSALTASAAPAVPPENWFKNPELTKPTPLTVTDEGKVFGHVAAWQVDHIGLPRGTKPPRSKSNYAYFRTGVVRTDTGKDVPVGSLTLAGGHAPFTASAQEAVKHYDDTSSAVADVAAGEDSHGIWVSGALRPDVTSSQVRTLRASSPSGDWRNINGRLELVAVCQVNVPGFPLARVMVASGEPMALVAAGARPLAEIKSKSLEDRISALENKELQVQASEFTSALDDLLSESREEQEALVASAKASLAELEQDTYRNDVEEANRILDEFSQM